MSERRLMTPDEMQAVELLSCVRFLPASWDKRFYRSVSSGEMITEKEAAQLWRIFTKYRRQINHRDKMRLLAVAETRSAPDFRKVNAAAREQARIDEMKRKHQEAMKQ